MRSQSIVVGEIKHINIETAEELIKVKAKRLDQFQKFSQLC